MEQHKLNWSLCTLTPPVILWEEIMGMDLQPDDNKIAHSCSGSFIHCGCGLILRASVYTLVSFIDLVMFPSRPLLSFHIMRFCKHKPKKCRIGKCYYGCACAQKTIHWCFFFKWSAYFHYSAVKLRTQHNHRHSSLCHSMVLTAMTMVWPTQFFMRHSLCKHIPLNRCSQYCS